MFLKLRRFKGRIQVSDWLALTLIFRPLPLDGFLISWSHFEAFFELFNIREETQTRPSKNPPFPAKKPPLSSDWSKIKNF